LLGTVGLLIGLGVNTALAAGMLTGLPRIRMPVRRVLGPALLVAVGLELLKTIGHLYVRSTEANPTYHLVAGSAGLLVFLSAFNQMVLFAAALTATSNAGRPADLAAGHADELAAGGPADLAAQDGSESTGGSGAGRPDPHATGEAGGDAGGGGAPHRAVPGG
jgi:membrane protein